MNREERLQQLLGTINHYCNANPEVNINNIAIQIAVQLADANDKDAVVTALLMGIKHMDNE
mgnify:CR=1 FL=1